MKSSRWRWSSRGSVWLATLLVASACAPRQSLPIRPPIETLPEGSPLLSRTLAEKDAWLRHYLMNGEVASAVFGVDAESPLAPRDRLVRSLQEGIVAHQARDYVRSNVALEAAEREAEARFTRSVTRAAASLLVNDGVMSYTPPAGELVMIPYYRMMNYLALGDIEGAVVESRKANGLLARLERDPSDGCREDGLVLYLAGIVQRAGGESNDALVSLRQAEGVLAACGPERTESARQVAADLYRVASAAGVAEVADTIAQRYALRPEPVTGSGELVLILEEGFVAHRAEQAIHIPVLSEDVDGLDSEDDEGVAAVAERITARLLNEEGSRDWWREPSSEPPHGWVSLDEDVYWLRLAWPTLRLEATRPAAVRVWVDDAIATTTPLADMSSVMREEMDRRRAAVLGRLVARSVVKYLVSREVEKKSEDKGGELAGFLLSRLANFTANQLEQADLRSWSLLPDRISLVRAQLPEGSHRIRIETLDRHGAVVGTHHIDPIAVHPGQTVVLNHRVWGGERGEW